MADSDSLSTTPRGQMRACWIGAILPVGLAFVAHVFGGQARDAVETRQPPSLAFSQYLVDEREPEFQPYYQANFYFKNMGDRTVTVTDLKPSCGCLSPKLDERIYPPGADGRFSLKIDPTREKPGPREYYVDVHYTDPEPQVARVTYKLVLPDRKIEISPKALLFYHLTPNGPETSQEVVISDYRERQLAIEGIESTSPLARAELTSKSEDESGNLHVRFKITVAGDVPTGTSRAIINLTTDDPQFRVLQVPVLIRGPEPQVSASELPIQPDPKNLVLAPTADGPVIGKVTLREISAQPLTITKAELVSANGKVDVGPLRGSDNGPLERFRDIRVAIELPEGATDLKSLLVIETDSPEQPRLEIPIVVERNPFLRR